jgi:hypothetical protein
LLTLIGAVDLGSVDRRFFHTVGPPDEMFAPDDVVTFLQSQPRPSRVWALPIPGLSTWGGMGAYGGDYPMLYGIEQVGGEHPNPLQRWDEYVGEGTQTYIDWHNLFIDPSIVGDTIDGQAVAFSTAPGFLDAANVRFVVSPAPLANPELREVYRGSALVYENATALPRAYLVPGTREVIRDSTIGAMRAPGWDPRQMAIVEPNSDIDLPSTPLTGSAEISEYQPDRVVVATRANRPALLVLADNMYKGWEATIDGEAAPIHLTNHTFRGVVVPAGDHRVEFVFSPGDLYMGLYIYIASFVGLAMYGGFLLVRARRSRDPEVAV